MLIPLKVRIQLFNISRCGFYPHGKDNASFGSIEDVLTQLHQWSKGLDLSQTKILDPDYEGSLDPVYLFGIKKAAAGWVVSTWNEIPHGESGVASVSMNAKVGVPDVHLNEIKENSIPGYATYFWIVPGRNLLATIRFEGGRSGQPGLVAHIGRFMSRFMSYTIVEDRGGEQIVVGYTDKRDGIPQKVKPMFKTMVAQKPGQTKFLVDNFAKVRRVLRRGHLTTLSVLEKDFWQSTVRYLRGEPKPNHVVNQRVAVEIDYRPTRAELEAMIAAEEGDPDVTGWDDMGFLLDGEKNPRWLGSARASGEITLNVRKHNEVAVDLDTLLQALHDNQAIIFQFLK